MTKIHNIDPQTLSQWLESKEAVLIDVREPAEHRSESINGSRNLPLSQVTIDEAHLPEHKDKKLVIHCLSGKRSVMACEKLKNEGAKFDIWNLEGGISNWKSNDLPIITSGKKILPLDRQVQLTIGLMIVSGLTLSHLFNSNWLILPLIAGLGLMNAGITGWCGLAKLMTKMSWNK
jgi:rhodanese-related sulfurtransferase